MAVNSYACVGNLTRDAELRALPSGTCVADFGLAVNERKKNRQTGVWEDDPVYLDCNMFGNRAEKLAQYLVKGTKVGIQGRLHYRSWTDQETGKKRSRVEVIVNELEFMSRSEASAAPAGPNYGPAPAPPQNVVQAPPQVQSMVNDAFANATPFNSPYPGAVSQAPSAMPEMFDEDIPF